MADKPYDPVAERALFAERFKGTTNLDQRRRFAQDITEAQARDQERRQQDFERLQVERPEVGRLMLAREKEDRTAREGFAKKDLAERKFQWDQEKAGRLEQLNAKRLEIQMRQEDRMLRKEALDLDALDKQEEDMLAIEDTEYALRQKFGPGTPEYRQGLVEAFISHPNVDKAYRQMALKESGFDDPDAAYEDAVIKMRDFPGSRATIPLAGGGKATIVSPKDQKAAAPSAGRMDSLRTKIQKQFALKEEERDADYLNYLQTEFEKERSRGTTQEVPTQTAAAPTAATNNFTDPESYKKAYQNAASGTILLYNGKQYRKP